MIALAYSFFHEDFNFYSFGKETLPPSYMNLLNFLMANSAASVAKAAPTPVTIFFDLFCNLFSCTNGSKSIKFRWRFVLFLF